MQGLDHQTFRFYSKYNRKLLEKFKQEKHDLFLIFKRSSGPGRVAQLVRVLS